MAIYKLGPDIDQFKGSYDGATFQRCGKVFSIRGRKVPLNKRSVTQTASRNTFESIAGRWRNLSTGEKATFNNNAEEFPRTNSLGEVYTITGQNIQQSSNIILSNANLPLINTLPNTIAPSTSVFDTVAVDISLAAADFVLFPSNAPSNFATEIWATRGFSAGTQFVSDSEFRLLKRYLPGESTLGNLWPELTTVFSPNSFSPGQVIFARARFIALDSGQLINYIQERGDISA